MNIQIYSFGLANLSVCAPKTMKREDVERQANAEHPTGIESKWTIAEEPTFATGEPIPHECEQDTQRQHWLLHC